VKGLYTFTNHLIACWTFATGKWAHGRSYDFFTTSSKATARHAPASIEVSNRFVEAKLHFSDIEIGTAHFISMWLVCCNVLWRARDMRCWKVVFSDNSVRSHGRLIDILRRADTWVLHDDASATAALRNTSEVC